MSPHFPSNTLNSFNSTLTSLQKQKKDLSETDLVSKLSNFNSNEAKALLTSVFGVAATKTDLNNDGITDVKDLAFKMCRLGNGEENVFSTKEATQASDLVQAKVKALEAQQKAHSPFTPASYNNHMSLEPGATVGSPFPMPGPIPKKKD
jgi:hypothetical protein